MVYLKALIILSMIFLVAPIQAVQERTERRFDTDILTETFGITEAAQSDVPLDQLMQGCPATDCIPAIDRPKFVAAARAIFLGPDDLVLGLRVGAETRAYPAKILDRHEIVNDVIGGRPIAISYCPLCGSGVAFSRRVNGSVREFGVSGLLHNSDLVMYDRTSKSLWQQITGEAFAGPCRGSQLEQVPLTMTDWSTWRAQYPDTQVLSTDTGFDREYYADPYAAYRDSEQIWFPVSATDARLHAKKLVYGVEVDGQALAFDAAWLQSNKSWQGRRGEYLLQVDYHTDGSVTVIDRNSQREFTAVRLFWFAWYTFHTDTELIR